jgi:DNA polymerase
LTRLPYSHLDLRITADDCDRCALCETRSRVVHGRGSGTPRVVFIGEAPGADEDACGEPFRGRSGALLDVALTSAGYRPEDYRITNAVRCRPPNNRRPTVDEVAACSVWLRAELALCGAHVLVTLGSTSSAALLGGAPDRGRECEWQGHVVRPVYHPAWLLRRGGRMAREWSAWVDELKEARERALEIVGRILEGQS